MSYQLFEYEGKWVSLEQLNALKKRELGNQEQIVETEEEQQEAFCDSCDSKGKRHKKECPKNNSNEQL